MLNTHWIRQKKKRIIHPMIKKRISQHLEKSRLIRLVLALALVFATLHVSQHEINETGNDHDCEVCRLTHIPDVKLTTTLSYVAPLFVVVSLISNIKPGLSTQRNPSFRYARAPPASA